MDSRILKGESTIVSAHLGNFKNDQYLVFSSLFFVNVVEETGVLIVELFSKPISKLFIKFYDYKFLVLSEQIDFEQFDTLCLLLASQKLSKNK